MHESAVTADILKIVLRYARLNKVKQVRRINLQIGELSDLEEELKDCENAIPPHSVKPQQILVIDELETAIREKKKELAELKEKA